MLARIRKSTQENQEGFTLIELLVVMIIIGILAAVAIPVFLSQRAKAQDTAAKADVSTLGKELATYYVDNTGAPPTISIVSGSYQYGVSPNAVNLGRASSGVALATQTGTGSGDWCISVKSTSVSSNTFKYSAANGLQTGTC